MRKLILGAAMVFLCANQFVFAEQIVARTDTATTPEWELKIINGRDFWNLFSVTYCGSFKDFDYDKNAVIYGPGIFQKESEATVPLQKLASIPAFSDTALSFYMWRGWTKNKDGSYSMVLPRIPKGLGDRPLFLYVGHFARLGRNPLPMCFGKIANDQKAFDAWLKENPNFRGFISGLEWLSDISNMVKWCGKEPRLEGWISNPIFGYSEQEKTQFRNEVSEAEFQKFKEEWLLSAPVKSFQDYLPIAKKYAARIPKMCFGDKNHQIFGDGHICSYHLVAKWGSSIIWMETSRPWQMWQNQMISARGAARQFNKPWFWYVAAFGNGYDNKGNFCGGWYGFKEGSNKVNTPFHGLTHSATRRSFYMTYFSGANIMQRENHDGAFWSAKDGYSTLSRQGLDYIDFYNFTKKNPDRGVPYTPVALLSPWNKLSSRNGKYDGTLGGSMHNAFLTSIYRMYPDKYLTDKYPDYECPVMGQENPGKKDPVQREEGHEWCFSNNPYGDIFDQLTPDFEEQTEFNRIIPAYKVAVMLDDFDKNKSMANVLTDYVKNGGTLVINTRQMNEFYPPEFTGVKLSGETVKKNGYTFDVVTPAGAKIILTEDGSPVFTRNQFGKGAVIVSTPQYMVPDVKGADAILRMYNDARSGKQQFPYIKELLDMICPETIPIKVSGDIHYGLNKTKTGWWIYLLNNKGVYRLYGDPEKLDPKRAAEVTIDISMLNPQKVTELFTNTDIIRKDGKVALVVPPGDIRCLRVDCAK